jgi:hypothetical protein
MDRIVGGSNEGKGTVDVVSGASDFAPFTTSPDVTGRSWVSSAGVEGREDSTVDVDEIESLMLRCKPGTFVGEGKSFKPRPPSPFVVLGRFETPKAPACPPGVP